MIYLKINDTDISHIVKGLKIGYETLVAETGRNANGDTVLDVINKKIRLDVEFRPMDSNEMLHFLSLLDDYVVNVSYLDSRTNTIKTVSCYSDTPEPEYHFIHNDKVLYRDFSLKFAEL